MILALSVPGFTIMPQCLYQKLSPGPKTLSKAIRRENIRRLCKVITFGADDLQCLSLQAEDVGNGRGPGTTQILSQAYPGTIYLAIAGFASQLFGHFHSLEDAGGTGRISPGF